MKREPSYVLRKRLIEQLTRQCARVARLICDIEALNAKRPDLQPVDCERDKVLLEELRGARFCVFRDEPIPEKYSRVMNEMAETGEYEPSPDSRSK